VILVAAPAPAAGPGPPTALLDGTPSGRRTPQPTAPSSAEAPALAGRRETTPTVDVDVSSVRPVFVDRRRRAPVAAATQVRSNNRSVARRSLFEPGEFHAVIAEDCAPRPRRPEASAAATIADPDGRSGGGGPHMRLTIKTNRAIAVRARAG
jgi:hypothetical protein